MMTPQVRLTHSIYTTDPQTGNQQLLARQGQLADIDRTCFDTPTQSVNQVLQWKDGIRIRPVGSDEWIDVHCWNVEPVPEPPNKSAARTSKQQVFELST